MKRTPGADIQTQYLTLKQENERLRQMTLSAAGVEEIMKENYKLKMEMNKVQINEFDTLSSGYI